MKISEFVEKLDEFKKKHGDCEVTIIDGYNVLCYHTNDVFLDLFDGCCDIGIGGCLIEEDDDK